MLSESLNAPKQERSRRTLERIVRASIEILEQEGLSGLTVQAIVRRANASVGSFYARFAGKDDLVDYLGERVWTEAAERWDQALGAEDWSALDLRGAVEAAVRLLDAGGRSRHVIFGALGRSVVGDRAYGAFEEHVLAGLEELLAERAAHIGARAPRIRARIGLRAVLGALETPLEAIPPPGDDDTPLTAERRATEAERVLLTFLSGEAAPAPGDRTRVDFFDIWG